MEHVLTLMLRHGILWASNPCVLVLRGGTGRGEGAVTALLPVVRADDETMVSPAQTEAAARGAAVALAAQAKTTAAKGLPQHKSRQRRGWSDIWAECGWQYGRR